MPDLQLPINEEIRRQLEKFHCTRGHLRYQSHNGSTILSLNGWRADGKAVLLWQETPVLGAPLAQKVAAALRANQLADYHRDYCGTGLQLKDGIYYYGEVWDGFIDAGSSLRKFDDQPSFVAWLAAQSDASLARLEEKNPWYWGNQTITRQRLEEFVEH